MDNAAPSASLGPPKHCNEAPQQVSGEALAARLAARLVHDLMSPASGIVSGLDLLEDPGSKDLHPEALELVGESARRLTAALTFYRAAFSPSADAPAGAQLETLARSGITNARAELDWRVDPVSLPGVAARALLGLVQIAAGALPMGGRVRASSLCGGGWCAVAVEAVDGRLKLHPEIAAGLRGQALVGGMSGRWAPAFWLHAHVAAAGGLIGVELGPEKILLRAAVPN